MALTSETMTEICLDLDCFDEERKLYSAESLNDLHKMNVCSDPKDLLKLTGWCLLINESSYSFLQYIICMQTVGQSVHRHYSLEAAWNLTIYTLFTYLWVIQSEIQRRRNVPRRVQIPSDYWMHSLSSLLSRPNGWPCFTEWLSTFSSLNLARITNMSFPWWRRILSRPFVSLKVWTAWNSW